MSSCSSGDTHRELAIENGKDREKESTFIIIHRGPPNDRIGRPAKFPLARHWRASAEPVGQSARAPPGALGHLFIRSERQFLAHLSMLRLDVVVAAGGRSIAPLLHCSIAQDKGRARHWSSGTGVPFFSDAPLSLNLALSCISVSVSLSLSLSLSASVSGLGDSTERRTS